MNTTEKTQRFNSAFVTLVSVFFFWGFVAASNGVFIPFCKEHFQLNQFQSQLIDTAFYAAYFIGSLVLWLASQYLRRDILNRIGYKKGIIYGLLISVAGALCMIPSVHSGSFGLILSSLFLIALGFSLQQVAAQPYVVALGSPSTGAHRLTLAQGVNSFGTLTGPLLMSVMLFGGVRASSSATIASIDQLYMVLAAVFLLATGLLAMAKLPVIRNEGEFEPGLGALKFPQLRWGMVAIFIYVGVEVSIQSNLGALLKLPSYGGYEVSEISRYIALYWGSLMIGRWSGALSAFNMGKWTMRLLQVVVPIVAFAIILGVNYVKGNAVNDLWVYLCFVLVMILATWYSHGKPARMLTLFASLGVISVLVGLMTTGRLSMFSFISAGLWCSIGWPCIFALSISGLGNYTSQGSAFLVMMILGGALVPLVQGWIADHAGIHQSYWVAVVCFVYLAWFGTKVKKVLSLQGLNPDETATSR